jgi:hypothetical protein
MRYVIVGFSVEPEDELTVIERAEIFAGLHAALPNFFMRDLLSVDVFQVKLSPSDERQTPYDAHTFLRRWDEQHEGRLRWFVQVVSHTYLKLYHD